MKKGRTYYPILSLSFIDCSELASEIRSRQRREIRYRKAVNSLGSAEIRIKK